MKTKSILAGSVFMLCATFAFAALQTLDVSNYTSIQNGDANEHIAALQNTLNSLGYIVSPDKNGDPTPASGVFDDETVQAIKILQKENDLKVTGTIDKETVATINAMVNFINNADEDSQSNGPSWWDAVVRFFASMFN